MPRCAGRGACPGQAAATRRARGQEGHRRRWPTARSPSPATVKNKGSKKAHGQPGRRSTSPPTATASANDAVLGTVHRAAAQGQEGGSRRRPSFPLPPWRVAAGQPTASLACADTGRSVKERKETNNCKASSAASSSRAPVHDADRLRDRLRHGHHRRHRRGQRHHRRHVRRPPPAPSRPRAPARSPSRPTAAAGYRFGAWSGATCTGFTNGSAGKITFTKPTAYKACTATFVKQVTISWSVSGRLVAPARGQRDRHGDRRAAARPTRATRLLRRRRRSVGIVTLTASAGVPPCSSSTAGARRRPRPAPESRAAPPRR